jgi:hypothetical protein
MLTISTENTGTFELPPAGAVAARCCRLIDLGSQESTFEGKTSLKRKVLLTWELAELRSDGSPFTISRRFGLSLHENAALRAFLQAWRGRPFTDDELAGFDLRKLINAPCLLNIAHTSRNGKDYSKHSEHFAACPRAWKRPPWLVLLCCLILMSRERLTCWRSCPKACRQPSPLHPNGRRVLPPWMKPPEGIPQAPPLASMMTFRFEGRDHETLF